jgi:pimeloyl-ACP methyl ester carboxylesterase
MGSKALSEHPSVRHSYLYKPLPSANIIGMNSGAAVQVRELPPLHSETLGSKGPTVVLLHGWGRSADALRPLGELLASDCKVVVLDLPGFGRSPLPYEASNDGGGWGTLEYSERVKSFLDQSGIKECILVGHSFGGRLSVRLAAKYPEMVKGLVLIGSHGLKRKRALRDEIRVRAIKMLVSAAKTIDGATGSRLFAHYLAPKFGSRDYNAAGDLKKTLVKTVNEDLSAQASTIKAPSLLLWGVDDRETPLDLAQSFNHLIADSKLYTFPNKGHEPFADVGCHLLAQYILQFISSRGLTC